MAEWNIVLVSFPNQYLLASAFMRFQEYYESPEFRDRIFDREAFEDWYAETRGSFSYYDDWAGFNLPSRVFRPFLDGDFNPLTRKEHWLLDAVRALPEPYYVIGIIDGDTRTLAHEVVHGLFTLFPVYQNAVLRALRPYRLDALHRKLHKLGYDASVFDDESNAYLATGLPPDWKLKNLGAATHAVREVFERHFGFRIEARGIEQQLLQRVRRVDFPKR